MGDNYNLNTKQDALRMNDEGLPVFEISTKLKVPVPLLVNWIKAGPKILKEARVKKRRKVRERCELKGPKNRLEAEGTKQLKRLRNQLKDNKIKLDAALEEENAALNEKDACPFKECVRRSPVKVEREPENREFHVFNEENPFLFEYDKPYCQRMMRGNESKMVTGIVPRPKERFNVDIFGPEYSTIKEGFGPTRPYKLTRYEEDSNVTAVERLPKKQEQLPKKQERLPKKQERLPKKQERLPKKQEREKHVPIETTQQDKKFFEDVLNEVLADMSSSLSDDSDQCSFRR